MGRYVLSGSQNTPLLEKISQSLAGRVAVLKLLPFSMAELFDATKMPDTPETALFQGGYPALHDRIIDPADYFPSYLETYLERDVRDVINVKDPSAILQFCAIMRRTSWSTAKRSIPGNRLRYFFPNSKKLAFHSGSDFIIFPCFHLF